MKIDLKTPSPADMREFNENSERPYVIADACLLDGGAVELSLGGVTVAGVFHDYDAYELAHAVLDMDAPEAPLCHDSVEWQAASLTEDELEWTAWSALEALHSLRSRQEAAVEPEEVEVGESAEEPICSPQNAAHGFSAGGMVPWTAEFSAVRDAARPHYADVRFLEPVGVMSHEEVATAFAKLTDKSVV